MTLKDLNIEKEKLRIKMRRSELSLEDKQKLKDICSKIDEIEIPRVLSRKYLTLEDAREGLKNLDIIYSTKISPKSSLNDVTKHICARGPKKGKIHFIDKDVEYCSACGKQIKHRFPSAGDDENT